MKTRLQLLTLFLMNVDIYLLSRMPSRLTRPLDQGPEPFERSSPAPGDSGRKRKRQDADTRPRKVQKTDNQVSIYLSSSNPLTLFAVI
jgi:hypothetical protein